MHLRAGRACHVFLFFNPCLQFQCIKFFREEGELTHYTNQIIFWRSFFFVWLSFFCFCLSFFRNLEVWEGALARVVVRFH